ncbi:hypothetical protein ABZW96_22270 [Nocardia sp. NPDC004168]|uniref:effector-associated constant component EACC1 n=1 Tax=Nocardia sp. NPDC004168 TaxID=3154452 RepID=UPI0033A2F954
MKGGRWSTEYIRLGTSSATVLIAAIKKLPGFLRSRRSDVTIEVETGADGQTTSVTITATNTTDAERLDRICAPKPTQRGLTGGYEAAATSARISTEVGSKEYSMSLPEDFVEQA